MLLFSTELLQMPFSTLDSAASRHTSQSDSSERVFPSKTRRASVSTSPGSRYRDSSLLTGFWSWDTDKAEMVFCNKFGEYNGRKEASGGKSPAKVGISTESSLSLGLSKRDSPSSSGSSKKSFSDPRPSRDSLLLQDVQASALMHHPLSCERRSAPAFGGPSLPPSTPPPLRFDTSSNFTGWLLPDGIDTSIPEGNFPDLPDLSNSSFSLANISVSSEHVPLTPRRNIGLGLNLGSPAKAEVLCHDGVLSDRFLVETMLTFNAMELEGQESNHSVSHRGEAKLNRFTGTPKSLTSGFVIKDSTKSPSTSTPRKTVNATKPNKTRGSQSSELDFSPSVPVKYQSRIPKFKTKLYRQSVPIPVISSTSVSPPLKSPESTHRSFSLQRRGRDVTVSTICSSLKGCSSNVPLPSSISSSTSSPPSPKKTGYPSCVSEFGSDESPPRTSSNVVKGTDRVKRGAIRSEFEYRRRSTSSSASAGDRVLPLLALDSQDRGPNQGQNCRDNAEAQTKQQKTRMLWRR
ncbi:hypothetical protein D9757_005308 [Collybiopsis confluens]|uniref:Uncharacterized protein n=1 Tax=Collybiopsis confluens TaxID=2823264 RepID=A0A8H5ME62_9AGAR|nr:hypothetical protein D9757_005308 [Collybiopsis confluens]